jgi:hypothetical protein
VTEAGAMHNISDATAIHFVLTALEPTGMFTDTCADRKHLTPDNQTLINFKRDMDHTWDERNRRVKANDVGYHDALSARMAALSAGKENTPPSQASKPSATVEGIGTLLSD